METNIEKKEYQFTKLDYKEFVSALNENSISDITNQTTQFVREERESKEKISV